MAFRAPRYSYVHAARDSDAATAITLSQIEDPDFPKDNLIDDRAGTRFQFNAAGTPNIVIDLGSGYATLGLDRLIIPADHNIEYLSISEDTVVTMDNSPQSLSANAAVVEGVLIDREFYTYYLPQLFLTKIMTLDIGPDLRDAPDWKKPNVTRLEQKTGLSPTVQNGPDQRYLEYDYVYRLSDAGASTDLTDIEAFVDAVGMYRPFYVDPASFSTPPETDEPALWMKFLDYPKPRLGVDVPQTEERSKTYTLQLIESLD
jgi:hypothetical protein